MYRSFDILSPWTVGRFTDDEGVDRFYREEVRQDLVETNVSGSSTCRSSFRASRGTT